MEMAAIFDFRALTKVHLTSNAVKICTHLEGIVMKKRTVVFLVLFNIKFLIMFCVKNIKKIDNISDFLG